MAPKSAALFENMSQTLQSWAAGKRCLFKKAKKSQALLIRLFNLSRAEPVNHVAIWDSSTLIRFGDLSRTPDLITIPGRLVESLAGLKLLEELVASLFF